MQMTGLKKRLEIALKSDEPPNEKDRKSEL